MAYVPNILHILYRFTSPNFGLRHRASRKKTDKKTVSSQHEILQNTKLPIKKKKAKGSISTLARAQRVLHARAQQCKSSSKSPPPRRPSKSPPPRLLRESSLRQTPVSQAEKTTPITNTPPKHHHTPTLGISPASSGPLAPSASPSLSSSAFRSSNSLSSSARSYDSSTSSGCSARRESLLENVVPV